MPPVEDTTTPVVAPVVTVAAEVPKPLVQASSLPEEALSKRLEQAKKTGKTELLTELGVASTEELQAAIAAHKATVEAQKTAEQKAIERETALNDLNRRFSEYQAAIDSTWAAESAKLTPEQLEAVTTVAGENAAARIRALNALRNTWGVPAAPRAETPAAPPANTSPVSKAPAPAGTQSLNDPKAIHAELLKVNPIAAARYADAHSREIFPDE